MQIKELVNAVRKIPKSISSEREIYPGAIEERRGFLWKPMLVIGGLVFAGSSKVWSQSSGSKSSLDGNDLDFNSFFNECSALANAAAKNENLNEEDHLCRLLSFVSRLRLQAVPTAKLGLFAGINPPIEFGPIKVSSPLSIIQWKLAPNAVLPAHNHNPADIVSVCLEGETLVRHFDLEGPAPEYSSTQTFRIRETRSDVLTPGRVSTLTQRRDNIHTFIAGDNGALGMDVNSFLPGNKPFSFLDYSSKPIDPKRRVYEAVWRKIASA
ncbi:MAG TPA: hypothetical protein VFC63_03440 [Blastocatellia bacterium]|nr:hypothetical protein [Blastocatellia bacterium]